MNWEEDGLDHLPEATWNDREEAVEAGHPLRHDRPTDEEWLIGDIDNYEDLRDVQGRG